MEKLRVLSLFSGIGAFEKGLKNCNIKYDLVGFSEIDKYAAEAYSKIHNEPIDKNLGDITKINIDYLPEFDVLFAGFPCQSISKNGKMEGFKTTETKSGLVRYVIDIIGRHKPKYIIMENVKNIISNKFIEDFKGILSEIESFGYYSSYKLLNSKDFGIPQNRERVYVVFTLKEIGFKFDFSNVKKYKSSISLNSLLIKDDSIKNISEEVYNRIVLESTTEDILDKKPEIIKEKTDKVLCLNSKNKLGKQPSQQYRVYSRFGVMTTLSAELNGRYNVISSNGHLRKLTPRECYLLQGFSEEDFLGVKNLPTNALYRQAGNTITVNVLSSIFKELFFEGQLKLNI